MTFVSRAGEKLQHALTTFDFSIKNLIVADFGSSTGGFVDCLLQNGVAKAYSIDTAYGELEWNLRNNPQVVVLERTNAMHVSLPEKVDLITVDTSWTKQEKILPNAVKNIKNTGKIITLVKPHYEAGKAKLTDDEVEETLEMVKSKIENLGLKIENSTESPIVGEKGGNREFLMLLGKLTIDNE